ncbi:MAG: hypothetical protein ACI8Z1_002527 [Candidatus Azotimanducaceae bacterium]|jgi:hypothetical protein
MDLTRDSYEFVGSGPPEVHRTKPDMESQLLAAERSLGLATIPCVVGDQSKTLIRISDVYKRTVIWLLALKDTRRNRRDADTEGVFGRCFPQKRIVDGRTGRV